MNFKNKKICVIFSFLLVLQGCAATATGTRSSAMRFEGDVSLDASKAETPGAFVVIRYPAAIVEEAKPAFYRAFENNVIGDAIPDDVKFTDKTENTADALLTKSNYYVMSIYRELQKMLPEGTVLLSPHLIKAQGATGITSEPLTYAEEIPTVLTVDFLTYSHPNPEEMMRAEALTFGDTVTPLISVHTSQLAAPETKGLLMASQPIIPNAWSQAIMLQQGLFNSRLNGEVGAVNRSIDFLHFLNNGPQSVDREMPSKLVRGQRSSSVVQSYPLEKVRMEGDHILELEVDHSVDPFAEAIAADVAKNVVSMLNDIDPQRATMTALQAAIERFDPELAGLYLVTDDNSVKARRDRAELLIRAERDFIAAQSQKIYNGVYENVMGPEIRKILVAEHNVLEERRSLARRQNASTGLAIFTAAASLYALDAAADAAVDAAAQNIPIDYSDIEKMLEISIVTIAGSLSASESLAAQSQAIGENFLTAIAPELQIQTSVSIDFLESSQEITADNFLDFHQQALGMYQSFARSLDVILPSSDCSFRHPESSTGGRWYGECLNGLATGIGRGFVKSDMGEPIEYYGNAKLGTASGTGLMVLNGGKRIIEGGFFEGLPNGPVKVSVPSKRPAARRFEGGQDVGRVKMEIVPTI